MIIEFVKMGNDYSKKYYNDTAFTPGSVQANRDRNVSLGRHLPGVRTMGRPVQVSGIGRYLCRELKKPFAIHAEISVFLRIA